MKEKIKLGILSTAKWADEALIEKTFTKIQKNRKISIVITGGSIEISKAVFNVCAKMGIKFGCYFPDTYPDEVHYDQKAVAKAFGLVLRNSDGIVAFWDGVSSGTNFWIKAAEKAGMKVMKVSIHNPRSDFIFFWGKSSPFSNFYPCTIEDKSAGMLFECAEQAFMWHKARVFGDEDMMEKIATIGENPSLCRVKGKSVKDFNKDVWDEKREDIMFHILKLKFSQNDILKDTLIGSEGKILVEANPHDSTWGIGIGASHEDAANPKKWPGSNKLGQVLTRVREELINELR